MANTQNPIRLGSKPKAWATSVIGNLDRLTKDQSLSKEMRDTLSEIRSLIIEVLAGRFEGEETLSLALVPEGSLRKKKIFGK